MPTRRFLRWSLIVLGAASLAIVSCGPPNRPPPGADEGVTIRLIVDGPGRIGSLPTFSCYDDCEWTLPGDEPVTIVGLPAAGNVFVAWDGACDADPLYFGCTRVFEDGDVVTARFAQHALRLDLTGDGEGAFTITADTISVTCDADCGIALPALSYAIQYEARGTTGTTLGPWGGACESATLPDYCLVQVSGSTDVTKRWVHPPVAVDDPNYVVNQDAALVVSTAQGVLANDEDTEGDTLTAQLVSTTADGILSLAANGSFTYAPDDGFSGPDTFTYRARDAFGNLSNIATVTVTVLAPPIIESFTADDTTIQTGQSTTLRWNVTGADTITINDGTNDLTIPPGATTLEITPNTTTTYTLTATNPDGNTTATVTVTVLAPPIIESFAATPTTITIGDTSTLAWNVNNATNIEITDGANAVIFDGTDLDGTTDVTPNTTTTYTLTAINPDGNTTATVTVTVLAVAPEE